MDNGPEKNTTLTTTMVSDFVLREQKSSEAGRGMMGCTLVLRGAHLQGEESGWVAGAAC